MDFDWTREQLEYRDSVAAVARTLNADVVARDSTDSFSRDAWNRCAERTGAQAMTEPGCSSDAFGLATTAEAGTARTS